MKKYKKLRKEESKERKGKGRDSILHLASGMLALNHGT